MAEREYYDPRTGKVWRIDRNGNYWPVQSARDTNRRALLNTHEEPVEPPEEPVEEPVEMSMPPWLAISWRALALPASDLMARTLLLLVMTGRELLMPVKAKTAEAVVWPPIVKSTVLFLG